MARIVTLDHQDTALDVLGRVEIAAPKSIFESYFEYDSEDRVWDTYTTGGASFAYNTTTRSCSMTTGGSTSGARVVRQTRVYLRFRRGKSIKINPVVNFAASGTFSGAAKSRVGYYDDSDGVFFQYSSAGFAILNRASGSGSVVDTTVPQSQWNLDKLDGTGPSRLTLDPTKGQSTIVEFNSFRTGRIRLGFRVDDRLVYCHQFNTLNATAINFKRRSLPLRYEVLNDGGAGSNITLSQGGSFVNEQGDNSEESTYLSSFSNGVTSIAVSTTLIPILSIRLKDQFNGQDARATITLLNLQFINLGNNPIEYHLIDNPTLTGASFSSLGASSQVEGDVSATVVSGGNNLVIGYANSTAGSGSVSTTVPILFPYKPTLGRSYLGVRDTLTVAARTISGNSSAASSLILREYF